MAEISGWYYDLQQKYDTVSRITTVSLHANSAYESKDSWSYAEKGCQHKKWGDVDEDGYFIKPLCTAILNEEMNVSANNKWSDMGEDMIGSTWDNFRTHLAPFAPTVIEAIKNIVDQSDATINDKDLSNSTVANFMMGFAKMANKAFNGKGIHGGTADNSTNGEAWVAKYLNSALVSQGSRFTVYQGTDLNFSNMAMRFTLTPTWTEDGDFLTVHQQLKELYPYFFGEYVPADFHEVFGNTGATGAFADFIESKLSFQRPPGGYQSDHDNLDATQKGSLKLKLGAFYALCNVVVDNITLNFSKQLVKNPQLTYSNLDNKAISLKDPNLYISPFSCDVTLTLRPCTKYSDKALRSFVEGVGMLPELNQLASDLQTNLNSEKEVSNRLYKEYVNPKGNKLTESLTESKRAKRQRERQENRERRKEERRQNKENKKAEKEASQSSSVSERANKRKAESKSESPEIANTGKKTNAEKVAEKYEKDQQKIAARAEKQKQKQAEIAAKREAERAEKMTKEDFLNLEFAAIAEEQAREELRQFELNQKYEALDGNQTESFNKEDYVH